MAEQIERLRSAILDADSRINESIKWNAPSFYIVDHLPEVDAYMGTLRDVQPALSGPHSNRAARWRTGESGRETIRDRGSGGVAEVGGGRSRERHLQKRLRGRRTARFASRHRSAVDCGHFLRFVIADAQATKRVNLMA